LKTSDAHSQNQSAIMGSLVLRGESSRQQIVADSGLSKSTVSRLVRQLVDDGRIIEGPLVNGSALGRSTQILEFRGADELVCGIDVGGTTTRFIVADHRARWVSAWRTPTSRGSASEDLAAWITSQVTEACIATGTPLPTVTVIGVPGVVQPGNGRIRHSPNLRSIEGDRFGEQLTAGLEGTCVVVNDSNLALTGELCAGAAVGSRAAAMVTIGDGVGCGVALDGHLLTGATGLVGEVGMLPVELVGTTLDEVISGPAITRQAAALGLSDPSPMAVLGGNSSPAQATLRRRILDALYTSCAALVIAYEPDVIVIGGGVSQSLHDSLVPLQQRLSVALDTAPQLRMSRLGDLAVAVGAVAIGLGTAYQHLGATVNAGDDEEFCRAIAVLAGNLENPPRPTNASARQPPSMATLTVAEH
jgi:predicted NBD/HSP70 family sugar kinase